ncbi:anti-sigma regulatory factor [Synechococcales cyanobacterium C]|uniref:Anti-sigma regulatory factor n=1 Tax=Petrachloros mirabilis ULC683 TaxID=2781853 RepID=A0A8K2A9Z9_9CYAN|nr:anti-sigma regulatory factor [Petrachloros mirabilis ULC683]
MNQNNHLQVKTDLNDLALVIDWINQWNPQVLSETEWLQCQIALAEGFTNAVRHAHRGLPLETPIEIDFNLYGDHLEICVWDLGPPFDLLTTLTMLPEPNPAHAESGRGLQLIRRVADELSYTRNESRQNCLRIVKYYT